MVRKVSSGVKVMCHDFDHRMYDSRVTKFSREITSVYI